MKIIVKGTDVQYKVEEFDPKNVLSIIIEINNGVLKVSREVLEEEIK